MFSIFVQRCETIHLPSVIMTCCEVAFRPNVIDCWTQSLPWSSIQNILQLLSLKEHSAIGKETRPSSETTRFLNQTNNHEIQEKYVTASTRLSVTWCTLHQPSFAIPINFFTWSDHYDRRTPLEVYANRTSICYSLQDQVGQSLSDDEIDLQKC